MLTKIVTCWLFSVMSIPIQIVSSWYYGGFFSTSIEKFLVLEPFLRSPLKIFDFQFFMSPTSIFHKRSITEVMLYILLTKFFTFCRFSFSPIPMLLVRSCHYGGFFSTSIENFLVHKPFLRSLQKILNLHFLTCAICIFLRSTIPNSIYFVD